jgi:hypothetical protein
MGGDLDSAAKLSLHMISIRWKNSLRAIIYKQMRAHCHMVSTG